MKDKGWAWMILLAAFVDLTLAGVVYINGIFNLVFLEEFGESRALTSWCGALQGALLNMGGACEVYTYFSNHLKYVLMYCNWGTCK